MYRGYDIAELAEHSTYEETALLLLDGDVPSSEALAAFERELADLRELPAETDGGDRSAGPGRPRRWTLRTASRRSRRSWPARPTGSRPTARADRAAADDRRPLPPAAPGPGAGRARRRPSPTRRTSSRCCTASGRSERDARAFDVAMILHAEHELNASTFTARVVAGTGADLTAAVVAAIAALSGPLHGGANEAAMAMFERIGSAERTPDDVRGRLERGEKLYGFGHPLYRAYDPRALILKRISRGALRGRRRAGLVRDHRGRPSAPSSRRRASTRTSTSTRARSTATSAFRTTSSRRSSPRAASAAGRRTCSSSRPTTRSSARQPSTSASRAANSPNGRGACA